MATVTRAVGFEGHGYDLFKVTLAFTAIAIVFVFARLLARYKVKAIGIDDCLIVVSVCFSVVLGVATCVGIYHGYGSPGGTLTRTDKLAALKMFYILQITYKFTINLTKVSILILYLRFFNEKLFKHIDFGIMAYVVSYAICSIFVTAFQCIPVARAWDKTIKLGGCINLEAFWYVGAATNISSDILILCLPQPSIWKMKLPRRQKIGLAGVFALGGFVCVTSILRMTTLKFSSTAPDQTAATKISTMWTIIEANTGIICSCLPMLRIPLIQAFPRLFGTTGIKTDRTNSLSGHTAVNSVNASTEGQTRPKIPLSSLTMDGTYEDSIHMSTFIGQRQQGRDSQDRLIHNNIRPSNPRPPFRHNPADGTYVGHDRGYSLEPAARFF